MQDLAWCWPVTATHSFTSFLCKLRRNCAALIVNLVPPRGSPETFPATVRSTNARSAKLSPGSSSHIVPEMPTEEYLRATSQVCGLPSAARRWKTHSYLSRSLHGRHFCYSFGRPRKRSVSIYLRDVLAFEWLPRSRCRVQQASASQT